MRGRVCVSTLPELECSVIVYRTCERIEYYLDQNANAN